MSLPWQPSRVGPSCGWSLAGCWRSGNRARCVRCSTWICGPLCILHDNCVEWGRWEWETEAAKTAGAQMMYWPSPGERNGDSEHSPSGNSRPGILLSAFHVPPYQIPKQSLRQTSYYPSVKGEQTEAQRGHHLLKVTQQGSSGAGVGNLPQNLLLVMRAYRPELA